MKSQRLVGKAIQKLSPTPDVFLMILCIVYMMCTHLCVYLGCLPEVSGKVPAWDSLSGRFPETD